MAQARKTGLGKGLDALFATDPKKLEIEENAEDLKGKTFAIWGLAFKPGTDDVREATSLVVAEELVKRGAKINAYDAQATEEFKKAIPDECLDKIKFAQSRYETVDNADALILITEWKEFRTPDWQYLIEKNMLYSKDEDVIRRLIDETPFTRDFGNDSPGRVGCYMGWRIVQSYMQNHPETTLAELMSNTKSQEILTNSGYKPKF